MVCRDCVNQDHNKCKERNRDKMYADCDCQHRVVKDKENSEGVYGDSP